MSKTHTYKIDGKKASEILARYFVKENNLPDGDYDIQMKTTVSLDKTDITLKLELKDAS